MLYLDLNAANQVTDVDYSRSASFMDIVRPDYTTMSDKTAFKVNEVNKVIKIKHFSENISWESIDLLFLLSFFPKPCPIGDCETFYSITPDKSLSGLRVKKVPDTKKCAPKVLAEAGIFSGLFPVSEEPGKVRMIFIIVAQFEIFTQKISYSILHLVHTGSGDWTYHLNWISARRKPA